MNIEKDMLYFVPLSEIQRIRTEPRIADPCYQAEILVQALRINILYMIKMAGSGHIGTSFSAIDIMTWLWLYEMNQPNSGNPNADIFFSSKGHDAPALYAILTALEKLPFDYIHKLRRLNGLPGHPDIHTSHIAANTGSLGMGISKAKGMAIANRLNGDNGRIFVLTGDGELQEGQFWESLQGAVNLKLENIIVIVDYNKIQSDTFVEKTGSLKNIESKLKSFGWVVMRTDGHNFCCIAEALNICRLTRERPKIIIADTIKGRGVSFMEKVEEDGLYKFHSGAPSDKDYRRALEELTEAVNRRLETASMNRIGLESVNKPAQKKIPSKAENLVRAYGEKLVQIGGKRKDIVVLDADLVKDTGLLPFKKEFPDRFVECGIAEQDMISVAGGLALRGKLPIVHSFACFLSTRPNEQIYNNASEQTKTIYVGSLAGVLPAGPGHSHQSVRDIAIFKDIPGLVIVQPLNKAQVKQIVDWAVSVSNESTYIRLANTPVDPELEIAFSRTPIRFGWSDNLIPGEKALVLTYGQTITREAYWAIKTLREKGVRIAIDHMCWLNRFDPQWLEERIKIFPIIFVIEDHYATGGLGQNIASAVAGWKERPRVEIIGLNNIPACGRNDEVLEYHGLDSVSLAEKIKNTI